MARTNLRIKVGTYTGDGADGRNITGVGFRPQIVIIKGGANAPVVRLRPMVGDTTSYFGQASNNGANMIQEILNDGFQVGTDAKVNANGTVYTYIAMSGNQTQRYFRIGKYVGSGADDRNLTTQDIYFTPNFVQVFAQSTNTKIWRITDMTAARGSRWDANATAADTIQDLISNGFQLGAGVTVNASGTDYMFWAMKEIAGIFKTGKYIADGIDGKQITGLGFQPDIVLVKRDGASNGVLRTSVQTDDDSLVVGAVANAEDLIQALETDGFQVGTDAMVNNSGDTYYYLAFKAGDFNIPIVRNAI